MASTAPERTVLDMTVVALAEVNPAAAAAASAAGANRVGHPSLGLLGWLPMADLLDVTRAAVLAHRAAGTEFWADEEPEAMAADLKARGLWCTPRADIEPWCTRLKAASDTWMSWPAAPADTAWVGLHRAPVGGVHGGVTPR